jgi:hypothetical protein
MAPSVAAGGGTQAVVALTSDPAAVTVVGYGGGEVALLTETVTAFLSDGVLVLLDAASGEQTLVWPDTDATGSAGHGMRCSSPDGDSGGGGHRSLNGGRRLSPTRPISGRGGGTRYLERSRQLSPTQPVGRFLLDGGSQHSAVQATSSGGGAGGIGCFAVCAATRAVAFSDGCGVSIARCSLPPAHAQVTA